jgi:hypothetical protein
LEASQVLTMKFIGISASVGITISLLMRTRDIFFGLTGLILGGIATGRANSKQQDEGV